MYHLSMYTLPMYLYLSVSVCQVFDCSRRLGREKKSPKFPLFSIKQLKKNDVCNILLFTCDGVLLHRGPKEKILLIWCCQDLWNLLCFYYKYNCLICKYVQVVWYFDICVISTLSRSNQLILPFTDALLYTRS